MRPLVAFLAAIPLALLTSPAPATAKPDSPAALKARVAARATAAALPPGGAGNGIFQVYVEQTHGLGVGSYTVLTGPANPAGPGHDVLFGNGVPGTSFMIIRDLTRRKEFVQSQYLTQPEQYSLDTRSPEVTPLGTTGFRTEWSLREEGGSASVIQDVIVHGSTQADSRVVVTTTITGSTDEFQVQYLWDVAVGADDGPVFQTGTYRPFAQSATHETTQSTVDTVTVADNDTTAAPTFAVGLSAAPVPQAVKYACWPRAVGAPLGSYETDPTVDVATPAADCTGPSGNDSAVILLFPPGKSVSAALSLSPRVPFATSIAVAPARPLNTPSLSATLTDTVSQHPVPGRTLTFSAGGSTLCSGVTNTNGVAGCGGTAEGLAAAFGYSASYPGGAVWAPATGRR